MELGFDFPVMCSKCGELFSASEKWDNATTAIVIVKDGTVIDVFCKECFMENIVEKITNCIHEDS
jgi:hypothetical protein